MLVGIYVDTDHSKVQIWCILFKRRLLEYIAPPKYKGGGAGLASWRKNDSEPQKGRERGENLEATDAQYIQIQDYTVCNENQFQMKYPCIIILDETPF